MYRGMILKYDKEQIITYTAFSFLDLLSASGGIISGLLAVFGPIAAIFSTMSWNLGVMRLLFMAKTNKIPGSKENEFKYRRVSVSNWEFLRLYLRLFGP